MLKRTLVLSALLAVSSPALPGEGAMTVESFQAAYRRSQPEEVRKDLIVAVGRSGDSRAARPLGRLLREERSSPYLQAWIVKTLCESLGSPEALKLAGDSLMDTKTSPVVALVVEQCLGTVRNPEGLAWMASAGLKDRGLRESVAWGLARAEAFKDPAPLLAHLALPDEKDWRIRAAAASGLARIADAKASAAVLAALETEPAAPVRRYLLSAAGRLDPAGALTLLRAALSDPDQRVRLGAIEGLAGCLRQGAQRGQALGLLVETLTRDRGRLRGDAARVLEWGTGRKFGLDVPSWRAYLQELGITPPAGKAAVTPVAEYFGLRMPSRRIVFVLEASLAMTWDRLTRQPVDRLARAKREMAKMVDALPAGTEFGIVAFGLAGVRWRDALSSATGEHKQAAKVWIGQQGGTGWPDFAVGLGAAWSLGLPAKTSDAPPEDLGADTLVLVSNGEPLKGDLLANDLHRWIMVQGRYRSVVVHTIGIGSGGDKGFLTNLALQTGGSFRNVD